MKITNIVIILTLLNIISLNLKIHKQQIFVQLYHNQTYLQSKIDYIVTQNNNFNKISCNKDQSVYNMLEINQNNRQNKLNAIITCNIHARQLLASEACLHFIWTLFQADNNQNNRNNSEYDYENQLAKFIINHINFRIFYNGNQMRDSALNGSFCRRTNKNDVDINRNFPTGYLGQKKGQQTNPGPTPLSQAFSQCIQQQVNKSKPDIFLDIHTGQFSLYYTTADNQSQTVHQNQQNVLNSIVDKVCANCRLRDDKLQGVMYVDMKVRHNIKWSNLFQIFGGYNQSLEQNQQCFTIFNPKTKAFYNYYLNRSKNMMMHYFYKIIQQQQPSAVTQFQNSL